MQITSARMQWIVRTLAASCLLAAGAIAATRTPAALLHLERFGTVAPGKNADFAVLDANPLDTSRTRGRSPPSVSGANRWTVPHYEKSSNANSEPHSFVSSRLDGCCHVG
jgi:cytosine/adenosine deaminase-related metal-dependent hydrolase